MHQTHLRQHNVKILTVTAIEKTNMNTSVDPPYKQSNLYFNMDFISILVRINLDFASLKLIKIV